MPPIPAPVCPQPAQVSRRLRMVRWLALLDAVLLVALVTAAVAGTREGVHGPGPPHGVNFLLLLVTVATRALDGLWGWWFPAIVLATAGPPGALIADRMISGRRADHEGGARGGAMSERGPRR